MSVSEKATGEVLSNHKEDSEDLLGEQYGIDSFNHPAISLQTAGVSQNDPQPGSNADYDTLTTGMCAFNPVELEWLGEGYIPGNADQEADLEAFKEYVEEHKPNLLSVGDQLGGVNWGEIEAEKVVLIGEEKPYAELIGDIIPYDDVTAESVETVMEDLYSNLNDVAESYLDQAGFEGEVEVVHADQSTVEQVEEEVVAEDLQTVKEYIEENKQELMDMIEESSGVNDATYPEGCKNAEEVYGWLLSNFGLEENGNGFGDKYSNFIGASMQNPGAVLDSLDIEYSGLGVLDPSPFFTEYFDWKGENNFAVNQQNIYPAFSQLGLISGEWSLPDHAYTLAMLNPWDKGPEFSREKPKSVGETVEELKQGAKQGEILSPSDRITTDDPLQVLSALSKESWKEEGDKKAYTSMEFFSTPLMKLAASLDPSLLEGEVDSAHEVISDSDFSSEAQQKIAEENGCDHWGELMSEDGAAAKYGPKVGEKADELRAESIEQETGLKPEEIQTSIKKQLQEFLKGTMGEAV